jgi:predicted transcriptional regulator
MSSAGAEASIKPRPTRQRFPAVVHARLPDLAAQRLRELATQTDRPTSYVARRLILDGLLREEAREGARDA